MAVWRCPHCATPQPEASRCWVCRRSTTCCATCRHFRRGVAGGLGLCGRDARHPVLDGTEMRACWSAAEAPPQPEGRPARSATGVVVAWVDELVSRRPRTFVPVEPQGPVAAAGHDGPVAIAVEAPAPALEAMPEVPAPGSTPAPAPVAADALRPVPGRWWLWGDPEPWPEP
jgi:hypothetical protein